MGIPPGSHGLNGKEPKRALQTGGSGTYKIACQLPTQGAIPGGKSSMQTCLQKDPNINLVYAINEPAAEGADAGPQGRAQDKALIVAAIDGGCSNLPYLPTARSPRPRASSRARWPPTASTRSTSWRPSKKPAATPGLGFFNTGTKLFTNTPVSRRPQRHLGPASQRLLEGLIRTDG